MSLFRDRSRVTADDLASRGLDYIEKGLGYLAAAAERAGQAAEHHDRLANKHAMAAGEAEADAAFYVSAWDRVVDVVYGNEPPEDIEFVAQ